MKETVLHTLTELQMEGILEHLEMTQSQSTHAIVVTRDKYGEVSVQRTDGDLAHIVGLLEVAKQIVFMDMMMEEEEDE